MTPNLDAESALCTVLQELLGDRDGESLDTTTKRFTNSFNFLYSNKNFFLKNIISSFSLYKQDLLRRYHRVSSIKHNYGIAPTLMTTTDLRVVECERRPVGAALRPPGDADEGGDSDGLRVTPEGVLTEDEVRQREGKTAGLLDAYLWERERGEARGGEGRGRGRGRPRASLMLTCGRER